MSFPISSTPRVPSTPSTPLTKLHFITQFKKQQQQQHPTSIKHSCQVVLLTQKSPTENKHLSCGCGRTHLQSQQWRGAAGGKEFNACLGYPVNSRPAWSMRPCLKNK